MLFWCVCFVFVIPANILKFVQTYPVYLQNGYKSFPINQPNKIQIYDNGKIAQNHINVLPSSMRHNLMNEILIQSPGQAALDPRINSCSYWNGAQNYQIPIYPANNYPAPIIYWKNDTSKANIEENTIDNNARELRKQRKRKRKSKTKNKVNEADTFDDNNFVNVVDSMKSQYSSRKNKIILQDTQLDLEPYKKENLENQAKTRNKNGKIKKQRKFPKFHLEKNVTTEVETNVDTTYKPKCRKKPKITEKAKNELNTEIKTRNEIEENLNLMLLKEGSENESRLTRNSNLEVNDFSRQIPNTREEITDQNGNSLIIDWFNNYKKFYELLLANQQIAIDKDRKTKKGKISKKGHKRKNTKTKNIIEATTIVNTKEITFDSTTTERIMYLSEHTETNFNSNTMMKSTKAFESDEKYTKYFRNEMFKDRNSLNEHEEKYDDEYHETYIDDYYPTFYDSTAYNANNKETILKNLNDYKYYYATDRIDTDSNEYYKKKNRSGQTTKDSNENKRTYDESKSGIVTLEDKNYLDISTEKELEFRSPPVLESPDFRTRQINKSEMISDTGLYNNDFKDHTNIIIGDKSSRYSSSKSPYYNESKHNEIKVPMKDIETVYAKSKVVSYGRAYVPEESSLVETSTLLLTETDVNSNGYQRDGTIYVIAESLGGQEMNSYN